MYVCVCVYICVYIYVYIYMYIYISIYAGRVPKYCIPDAKGDPIPKVTSLID